MKFKNITTIILATVLITSLSGCSSTKEKLKQSLNIGGVASIDVVPIVIAEEKGFFKKEGVEVKFQTFKSPSDRDAAFQGGSLDGVITDEMVVCLEQNSNLDVKITGSTDGDFLLIASSASGIKTAKDLVGKSVAISQNTAIEYTLDKILEKNSIDAKSVKKTSVPPIPTRLEMLRNNKVDAALLPEPYATLAIKNGGVIIDSSNKLDIHPAVTAFTQKTIDSKSNEIKAFYKGYNAAVDYINATEISEYEDIIIKAVGYPVEMKGKIQLPKFRKNQLPKDVDLTSVITWTKNKGLVKNELVPKKLINNIGIK